MKNSKPNRARLRSLMTQARLTQQATATLLSIDIRTVQRWLADPRIDRAEAPSMAIMALEAAVKGFGEGVAGLIFCHKEDKKL